MTKETQRPWPMTRDTGVERRAPSAFFTHPDGYLKSERSLAGPLRMGTAPGVGPSGALRDGSSSDFGMDRITPRRFDPIGNSLQRAGTREDSPLISRELRASNRRKDE
jgi:hypothetical protein